MRPRPAILRVLLGCLALAAPSLARAACDPPGVLASRVQYTVGYTAASAVEGYFDGDAHLDLAVTNFASNSTSVLLGDGLGNFTSTGLPSPVVLSPRGIAAGDFNGDDVPDLVVTGVFQKLYVLAGSGFGTFTLADSMTFGFENRGIVAADLDADGILDLVIASRASVSVLLGNGSGGVGDGTFGAPAAYPTPSSWGVAVADFNGDGALDIAAGNWLHTQVTLLLGHLDGSNQPDGTFTSGGSVPTPGGCSDITTGDINADGIADLVASGSSGVWVMTGNGSGGVGDGTFGVTAYPTGTQSNDAALADLDGDGDVDIAVSDTDAQSLRVLFNDGSGAFPQDWVYLSGTGPIGVVTADLLEDGRPDVAVVNSASGGFPGTVSVFLNRCGAAGFTLEPAIDDVRDVPNDQGGKVFVTWYRSRLDNPFDVGITSYRVWRRVHPAAPAAARVAGSFARFDASLHDLVAIDNGVSVEFWEPLETLPAAFLDGYGYTAPTTSDSTAAGNLLTAFFIQALTPNPAVVYNSAPDSGYSVDNLAPPAPTPFVAVYFGGSTALHWGPSTAPDFALFRLYRGLEAGFEPGPATFVTEQPDTGYYDTTGGASYFYKLAAIDVHGNTGPYSLVSPDAPTAALASLVSAHVVDGAVALAWYVSADEPIEGRIERRTPDTEWSPLGDVLPDGTGFVRWTDAGVEPGVRYAYRLRLSMESGVFLSAEAWIDVPGDELDLSVRVPNPVVGAGIHVSFAIPAGVSHIDLVDVAGRSIVRREVTGSSARSRQTVQLTRAGQLPPGLYFVRIDRPDVVRRVVVVR